MSAPLFATVVSGSLTVLWIAMLLVERSRKRRYLASSRSHLDRIFGRVAKSFAHKVPHLRAGVIRVIFHYLTHQVLSAILRLVRGGERVLVRALRFNRVKAVRATQGGGDTHLREIAEHKELTALTPTEKRKRKHQALKGDL